MVDKVEELRRWSRCLFPRGFAVRIGKSMARMGVLLNVEELSVVVNRVGRDVYANVFSVSQIEEGVYDTFFIDVDSHLYDPVKRAKIELDLGVVYDRMRKVVSKLDDAGLNYRVYFSGRGFHVYVDYLPVKLNNFSMTAVRFLYEVLEDAFGYIDTRVVGDKNRVARVPYTLNSKSGRYMIGVDVDMDLDEIIALSEIGDGVPQEVKPVDLTEELTLIDERISKEYDKISKYEEVVREVKGKVNGEVILRMASELEKMPYCVRDAVRRLVMTGELDHYERLQVATFLLRVWDYDDVLDLFRFANDFKEKVTRYQLDYILKRSLMPFSCKKAKMLGICRVGQDECLWRIITNGWIGSIFVDYKVDEKVSDNEDGG